MFIPNDPDKWYRFSSAEGGLAHAGVVAIRIKSDVLSWPTMFGKVRAYNYCMEPDRYCGLVLLFKTDNGEPLAILNDGVMQHLRVGATAAIAAKHMARRDASVLGILGSGGMAESHLQAYAEVRSLKLAKIYSPNREHRESPGAENAAGTSVRDFSGRKARACAGKIGHRRELHGCRRSGSVSETGWKTACT